MRAYATVLSLVIAFAQYGVLTMNAIAAPAGKNRLSQEKSPYLLQHKDNPVHWYAWGSEAFAVARELDRPIFLSIGYSTCYWCHVMEKDSFEVPSVAEILNQSFVSIKVDREEHPDVDKIYMDAVVAMTGQGGWPLSVFLTPDRKPFFGGTYFPREQFSQILSRIDSLWREDRANIEEISTKLTQFLSRYDEEGKDGAISDEILRQAYLQLSSAFDENFGGFGNAPKFPRADAIQLLLRINRRSGDARARQMAVRTLEAMAWGGMYDHLGGGFHRYSTDERWLVPHFEKMLYDNALLVMAYLEGYRATGEALYRVVSKETLDYMLREMLSPEGAFYSAQDAGEVGREGEYYVWRDEELRALLPDKMYAEFVNVYGVTERGNFEHQANVLALQTGVAWSAREESGIKEVMRILREKRALRTAPHLDDKILTAWNALAIEAFTRGYMTLGEERYLDTAKRAYAFVQRHLKSGAELLRRYRAGDARFGGYIDDYAYMVQAALSLFEATGELQFLRDAKELQNTQDRLFWDAETNAYFHSAASSEELIVRKKEVSDGAMPAGNSLSARNLLRLFGLTYDSSYEDRARLLIATISGQAKRYPSAFASGLMALDWVIDDAKEVVVVGVNSSQSRREVLGNLAREFVPNSVIAMCGDSSSTVEPEVVRNKPALDNKPTYYVCSGRVCKSPTVDFSVALGFLGTKRQLNLTSK